MDGIQLEIKQMYCALARTQTDVNWIMNQIHDVLVAPIICSDYLGKKIISVEYKKLVSEKNEIADMTQFGIVFELNENLKHVHLETFNDVRKYVNADIKILQDIPCSKKNEIINYDIYTIIRNKNAIDIKTCRVIEIKESR